MKILKIVEELKENQQDFEFYPTTQEIIDKVNQSIEGSSILDIGCGDGATLMKLKPMQKFGIEKSQILLDLASPDIITIGRDFYKQNLIDKKVDNVFCNPPYSDYENWTLKILTEANCKNIFLVIPTRWKESQKIKEIIKRRNLKYIDLGEYDFLNADRKARAKVSVLNFYFDKYQKNDPFDIFFEDTFKFNLENNDKIDFVKSVKNNIKQEIVKGQNLIERLVDLYDTELLKLLSNYKELEKLDAELLKELNIDIPKIKEGLKLKIENLKTIYWQELFNNLDKLTERLTSKNRNYISSTLINTTDFNAENIYSIVIWAIKNSNKYINSQLVDLFYDFTDKKNIKNYKSNQKTWTNEDWRWNKKKDISHFKLEYRIILEGCSNLLSPYGKGELNSWGYDSSNIKILLDLAANARNLGLHGVYMPLEDWKYGKTREIYYGASKIFMEVKLFKNGNIHIKFNQEFIQKLNIEVSRLLGWVKNKKEMALELGYSESEIENCYNSAMIFEKNLKLLN